jgi:hypothetical protein
MLPRPLRCVVRHRSELLHGSRLPCPLPRLPKYSHESFDECWYRGGMRPMHRPPMTPTQTAPLDRLYRTTQVPRLRTRAQMI